MRVLSSMPPTVCPWAVKKRTRSGKVPVWFLLRVPGKADVAACRGRLRFGFYTGTITRSDALDLSVERGESGRPFRSISCTSSLVKQVQHCSCFSLRGSLMNESDGSRFLRPVFPSGRSVRCARLCGQAYRSSCVRR